jgi:hypothetical protein
MNEINLELIRTSQLYLDMRPESEDVDEINTYGLSCMADLTSRTGLNVEQLCRMVLKLDITVILTDNRILNILGLFAFSNFEALCLEYVRHAEEHLDGMFANFNELYENVKTIIQKYTCPVNSSCDGKCNTCLDAVVNGHVWCLKRMRAEVIKSEWNGIFEFGILTDNLEIVQCLYEYGARPQNDGYSSFGPLPLEQHMSLLYSLAPALSNTDFEVRDLWARPDDEFHYPITPLCIRSVKIMKYCIEKGIEIPSDIMKVVIFGNLKLIKFLHKRGYRWRWRGWTSTNDRPVSAYAVGSGNLGVVKYVSRKCRWSSRDDIMIAIMIDSAEIVQYLIKHEKRQILDSDLRYAATQNNLHILKILFDHINIERLDHESLSQFLFYTTIDENFFEMFKFIMEKGFKPTRDSLSYDKITRYVDSHFDRILELDRSDMLKHLVENGYAADSDSLIRVVRYRAFNCFKYLHKNGCPRPSCFTSIVARLIDVNLWLHTSSEIKIDPEFFKYLYTNDYLDLDDPHIRKLADAFRDL